MREDVISRLLLQVPNRRRVYDAIVATPGVHLRRLSRDLELAVGSVEHHLRQLVKHGLIVSFQEGRRRGYYVAGTAPQDAAVLHAFQKPMWRDILVSLVDLEGDVGTIARQVGVDPAAASYHLRRLRERGLVSQVKVGRASVHVLEDPERVRRLHEDLGDSRFPGDMP